MPRKTSVVAIVIVVAVLAVLLMLSAASRERWARASPEPERPPGEEVVPGPGGSASSPTPATAPSEGTGGSGVRDEGVEPGKDDARRLRDEVIDWALDVGGAVCLEAPDRYLSDLWNVRFHRKREQVPEGTITGVAGPEAGADEWLAAMPARASLHAVDLRHSDITGRGLAYLAGKALKVLILTRCDRLQAADLQVLRTLPSLEILVLRGLPLGDRGLPYLEGLPRLRRLDLYGGAVTDAGVLHLLRLTALEDLELGETRVTAASLPALARLPALRNLRLPGALALDRAALDRCAGR